jgi:hypothetical protein
VLDSVELSTYTNDMAHAFMIFRFRNEEQAQQAWHKLEGWRQGFRLAAKLTAKFDRGEAAGDEGAAGETEDASDGADSKKHATKGHKAEHKADHKAEHKKGEHAEKGKGHKKGADGADEKGVRLIVKLNFSDHEKLSFQRWLDRIPGEEPFKSAEPEVHKGGEAGAAKTEELFDTLR